MQFQQPNPGLSLDLGENGAKLFLCTLDLVLEEHDPRDCVSAIPAMLQLNPRLNLSVVVVGVVLAARPRTTTSKWLDWIPCAWTDRSGLFLAAMFMARRSFASPGKGYKRLKSFGH